MNYLAHAYLSFRQPGVLIGNMISDFVKGKKQYEYPAEVFKGIKLHRAIDDFTDTHEATAKAKEYFRKDYRLYSGAFMDVVYDHYLANDESVFPDSASLQDLARHTYGILRHHVNILPERFGAMLPYMESQDWLYHYRSRNGIERSMAGLVRRSAYLEESAIAFSIFETHYDQIKACYDIFFPDLVARVKRFENEWSPGLTDG